MKRNHEIKIRLSDDELARLDGMVGKTFMSREAFVREMIAGFEICEAPDVDVQKLIVEVAHLGTAFNLFTMQAAQAEQIDTEEYRRVIDMVWEAYHDIRHAYLPKDERRN
jgi:hypothetical protein